MKRLLSKLLALMLILELFSGFGFSLDPAFAVTKITLTKNFEGISPNPFEYTLLIQGNKLQGTKVTYLNDMNQVQEISNVEYQDEFLIQYSLGSSFNAKEIFITNETYRLTVSLDTILSDMPTLNNLTPKKVKQYVPGVSIGNEGKIFVEVANFASLSNPNFEMYSFGTKIKAQVTGSAPNSFNATGEPGLQNVEFQKEVADADATVPGNQAVKIRYNYRNTYKITTDVTMSEPAQVSMFPNRGSVGTKVTFKAKELPNKSDASVFFVSKLGDEYEIQKKGTQPYYQKDVDDAGNDIFTVNVPAGVTPGEEYFVVFTNFVADNQDPKMVILRETVLDTKFFVISEGSGVAILDFTPKSGTDIGSELKVWGKYFLTLNIDKLTVDTPPTDLDKLKIDPNTDTLSIEYGAGKLKGLPVTNIKKEVTFYLNNTELILEKTRDFSNFTQNGDTVYLKTKEFLLAQPYKDVKIQVRTKTTFTDGTGALVEYSEYTEKGDYRFISSTIKPEIDSVNPTMVMVRPAGSDYQTEGDEVIKSGSTNTMGTTINILGGNFIVHHFAVSNGSAGETHYTVYPKVKIADKEYHKQETDFKLDAGMHEYLKVFNEKGEEVNGAPGNEVGNRIELKIPAGTDVPKELVSIGNVKPDVPVKVTNPKRNSTAEGLSDESALRYVVVSESEKPIVNEIEPDKINVKGSEDITVSGFNFKPGMKAYVKGEPATITRTDSENLKVNVPEGIIGKALLQLQNEDGGIVSIFFDYIDPFTKPQILSIIPDEGEKDTLSIISATRIFLPDPKGSYRSPLGRRLLLGTRAFLEGFEVNQYKDGLDVLNGVDPIPLYNSYEPLLKVQEGELKLAEDYESILLQEYIKSDSSSAIFETPQDAFMVLEKKVDGKIYIGDGNTKIYQVSVDNQNQIVFSNEKDVYYAKFEHGLNQNDYGQILYGPAGNKEAKCLKLTTFYKTVPRQIKIGGIDYPKEDIVGHRAVVKYKNQEREVYMHVPALPSGGAYDVKLLNPDNDFALKEDGFKYWNVEGDSPVIEKIDPDFGSVDGGYYVEITGKNFEKNILGQSKIIIAGQEIKESDVQISADRTQITFKMPPYKKDLKETYGVSRVKVPVIVSNSKGKSAYIEEGFTLVQAEDRPRVEKIIKNAGSPMGGEEVRIVGVDFKLREYGKDMNENGTGDDDYAGVDFSKLKELNPTWTNEKLQKYRMEAEKLLPKVYFGDVKVPFENIIQYTESEIRLRTPIGESGKVPVYVINYDSAISNQDVMYTYTASKVSITDFMPTQGDKIGGKLVEIKGKEFLQGEINLYRNEAWQKVTMPVVRFGKITNEKIESSGTLINSLATVDFEKDTEFSGMDIKDNGLSVTYNANPNAQTLTVRMKEGDQIFEKIITGYDGQEAYVDLRAVVGDAFPEVTYDLMRVLLIEGQDGYRLVVERGFAPKTKYFNEGAVSVYTPMYYAIGEEPIIYYNPDGERGSSTKNFKYINPPIRPIIEDIIDVEKIPANSPEKGNYYKIGPIGNVGRNFTIIGSGFGEGIQVKIGGVDAERFEIVNENTIRVKAPEKPGGIEYEEELLITIEGEGIDSATSADDNLRESGKGPIYFFYRKGSTDTPPIILGVEPIRIVIHKEGRLKIFGNYFRAENGSVRVRIDGEIVPVISVSVNEIVVQAPIRKVPGLVNIYIENKDVLGRVAGVVENETLFGYASDPIIEEIIPDKVSILGGDTVLIKGSGFLEGAQVLIGGTEAEILKLTPEEIKIKTPQHTLGKKDVEIRNTDYVADTEFGRFIFKEGIEYVVPRPELPTYFIAIPGYQSTVTLKWNEVKDALRYKLYIKTTEEADFIYLGETDNLEYVVKNLKPDTWYRFGLKPVTQFGDSEGMAFAACKTLTKEEDTEKPIGDADEVKITKTWQEGNRLNIQLADVYGEANYRLDVRRNGPQNVTILVPMKAILERRGSASIKAAGFAVDVSLYELSKQFPNLKEAPKDAFVKIELDGLGTRRKTNIERLSAQKLYGQVYRIGMHYTTGGNVRLMEVKNALRFGIYTAEQQPYFVCRYDPSTKSLVRYQTITTREFNPLSGNYEYLNKATLPQSGEVVLGLK